MTSELEKLISENTVVRIAATRNIPLIDTIGFTLEEKEEGNMFNLPFWIAKILVDSGLARFIDLGITQEEWMQIHFKERFNSLGPLTSLPEDFYSRAYLSLFLAKHSNLQVSSKQEIFNRSRARFRDILEARIGKITRLASVETLQDHQRMEREEVFLYETLKRSITNWRDKMRRIGDD